MKKIIFYILICIIVIISTIGCRRREAAEEAEYDILLMNGNYVVHGGLYIPHRVEIYQNLALLGKVWGFVKYTHNSFITGQKNWDAELLYLIPKVLDGGDIRNILYKWFTMLGDDGYVENVLHLESYRLIADLSWINYYYLGPITSNLLRFNGVTSTDRSSAPFFFGSTGVLDFSNQDIRPFMNFADAGERLLGLYRLWNAMNYFFPHLDVLDVNWNDLLLEFIPKMLEGTDRHSYELTLAGLAHHLHDASIWFEGTSFFTNKFGRYIAPIALIVAEGRIVVSDVYEFAARDAMPQRGDILLAVNGRVVIDIINEKSLFFSYPNVEKTMAFFTGRWAGHNRPSFPNVLTAHERFMYIDVMRGDFGMPIRINAFTHPFHTRSTYSHTILEKNIGLINPWIQEDVNYIMNYFASTDGLIIDLRQWIPQDFIPAISQYLLNEPLFYRILSKPSHIFPGKRFDILKYNCIAQDPYTFIYEGPVVLLIDENSFGINETLIMSLSAVQNVTLIGTNTMGSVGSVSSLPLPGRITMWFQSIGTYTPEGGHTFRIGLTPDINVNRTIRGITEGRDEIMETAIRFILGEK